MIDYSNPLISDLLKVLEDVLGKLGIDYFLVGAIARDIRLADSRNIKTLRRTEDVDIGILVGTEDQFQGVKGALVDTGLFKTHPNEPIKLIFQEAIEVDLLPFGGIENEEGETRLKKPRLFILEMPGFTEAFPDAGMVEVGEGVRCKVSSLEGLVLLKLIANDDNPGRTKDIKDIESIIQAYFEICDDDIYDKHMDVMESYDTLDMDYLPLISSRVIGNTYPKSKPLVGSHGGRTCRKLGLYEPPNEVEQSNPRNRNTDPPKWLPPREDGDRRNGDGDLEHGDGARQDRMPREVLVGLVFRFFGVLLDLSLLQFVARNGGIGSGGRDEGPDFGFDALGLVIGPLVGGVELFEDGLIGVVTRHQAGQGGEDGHERGGDGDVHGAVLLVLFHGFFHAFFDGLVKVFGGDFHFFHGPKIRVFRGRAAARYGSTPATCMGST